MDFLTPLHPLRSLRPVQGALALALGGAVAAAAADGRPNLANWTLAERFRAESLRPLVYSSDLSPGWIGKTDSFWYSWQDAAGRCCWRVDPGEKKKTPLFDRSKMAAQLSEALKRPYESYDLPIRTLTFTDDLKSIRFTVERSRLEYDLEKETLKLLPAETAAPTGGQEGRPGRGRRGLEGRGQTRQGGGEGQAQQEGTASPPAVPAYASGAPDGRAYVYAENHNLFFAEVGSQDKPIQLSTDGVENYSFGSAGALDRFLQFRQQQEQRREQSVEEEGNFDPTGIWPDERENAQQQGGQQQSTHTGAQEAQRRETRIRPNVTWSEDSQAFYIVRTDSRKVKDLWLVHSLSEPRPTLSTYRYAMPGEADVPQFELHVFRRVEKKLERMAVERYRDQRLLNIHWVEGSKRLRFVRRDRLQRNLELCELDPVTQQCGVLLTESVENAFLESQALTYVRPGGDFIWWSERTGWGHLYLYGPDGKLKHPITTGSFRVEGVVNVDAEKGWVYFRAVGREPGENPYYTHLYRIRLDGKDLTLMDPGDADHSSTLSPSRRWLVDVCSRMDQPPVALLRDADGKVLMELEKMDVSRLLEYGWRAPETFRVKAADGVTDIFGNLWKPTDFDPRRKYPIIANVYPGPQTESVQTRFTTQTTAFRLAQLGFIVIQIGNRGGSPRRSNAYHSYGYYNLRDYGLADKKAGIEQLAARHSWIDASRVGIYGHSGRRLHDRRGDASAALQRVL